MINKFSRKKPEWKSCKTKQNLVLKKLVNKNWGQFKNEKSNFDLIFTDSFVFSFQIGMELSTEDWIIWLETFLSENYKIKSL